MMHPEIPGELAELRRGDEAGLLELAKTYGAYVSVGSLQPRRGAEVTPCHGSGRTLRR
jgi:hypothetical protein